MKITADTNVLLRALLGDDPAQAATAQKALSKAQTVCVPGPVLCELVWVMRGLKIAKADIISALQVLIDSTQIAMDRPAALAALEILAHGGDFADGWIAHAGRAMGGEVFVSFDLDAVAQVERAGGRALGLS